MLKLAAVLSLLGTMAYGCSATEITETFTAVVTQVAGSGAGIFNTAAKSPVSGTFTFNPEAFTPNPVGPSGASYFAVFNGAAQSAGLTLSSNAGTASASAETSFLEVSSTLNTPWELLANGGGLSWSLLLDASQPLAISPGCSLFDLPSFDASTIDLQLSDSSDALTLQVSSISMVPEPRSVALLGVGIGSLFAFRRRRLHLPRAPR